MSTKSHQHYKVGLVGLGWWGKILFDFFDELEFVDLKAVAVRRLASTEGFDLRGAQIYESLEQMFDTQELDAVVLATPPAQHLESTRMAAERGVHVFCEKPMASTIEDSEAMVEVCEKYKVKLFVAFKHRYAKACVHVRNRLPEFGKPLWAMYTYPLWKVDDPGWKFKEVECPGILLENAVHSIDNLRYLVDADVHRIYAEGGTHRFDTSLPDTAVFTLRFDNGAIASIGAGAASEEVISQEYLAINYENAVVQIWGKLDYPYNLRICTRNDNAVEEHSFEGSDGVREEIRHFFDCIKNDEQPLATGRDGTEAVRVSLAVLESVRTGGIVELI